ncbi:MAG: hypothetical protein SO114_04615 [Candidatus Cryptobacteroides sp.]|nr:hypothetical protein [Candidatus Cryptobacteroides sp.]
MDRNYTSPSFQLEEVSWEGLLAGSADTPARGYEKSVLEDLE